MRRPDVAVCLLVASAAAGAFAQEYQPERVGDPYMPWRPGLAARSGYVPRGGLVQANTDAAGLDIPGDAANEPSIATDPRAPNRITIGWRQFDTIASNFRQAGYAHSNDGGRTWRAGVVDAGVFRTDPVLRAGPEGTIYWNALLTNNNDVWRCDIFTSLTGGASWGGPVFAYGGDKAWMSVDRTSGPGRGFLYQDGNTAGNVYSPNQFNRSLDGAANWSAPQALPSRPVFGTSAVGPDGELYVVGRPNSGGTATFYVVKSTNANNSAAAPTFVNMTPAGLPMGGTMRLSAGPNPAGLLGQDQVVVDTGNGPRRGWVYVLTSADPAGDDPMDVFFRRSRDGGATWDPLVRVNPDPALSGSWQWFGTISVSPDGRLDVVYNDSSTTLQANMNRLVYTSSADGGETWSTPAAQTPVFNTWLGWPNQNKIGDYYDMESDLLGAHVAFSATMNGGQDVYYLRVGPRDCNGNGVDDAAEIAAGAAVDCDGNGIPDTCELAAGAAQDSDGDGLIDRCDCDADYNQDGGGDNADVIDLAADIAAGTQSYPPNSPDFNGDGGADNADVFDLANRVAGGACP